MAEVVKKLAAGATFFDGTHIFTPHSDVPDDGALRLVVLAPEQFYSREESRLAFDGVFDYVRNNGTKPRYRGNRLIFVAPDHGALARLRDCIRVALAWNSIVEDVAAMRLVLDNLQVEQAKKELKGAEDVLPRVARECYKWLLCPSQDNPTGKPTVETFPLNTSGPSLGTEIERVCLDNELVIPTWSPIHLRTKLKELYWKTDKPAVKVADFWEDTLRYIYLPRLKDRGVLAQAIVKGAGTRDFFGTAYGQIDEKFEGFKFGDSNVQLDDTLLLIDPHRR
jgi:predicted AAA+ superfamily ATPase